MKTLLYAHHIDDSLDSANAVLKLAVENAFHLNIVVVGIFPSVVAYGPPGAAGFYYDGLDQKTVEDAKECVSEITKLVSRLDVSATISMECRGNAAIGPAIQNHALLADMSVFAHGSALAGPAQTETFNGALLGSGQPVLSFGQSGITFPEFRKILLAWNGHREAAKAMHNAVKWSVDNADIHIVVVDPHESRMGPNPGDDVAGFIARNGRSAIVDLVPLGDRSVSEVLVEHANDIDADSVFMGAYGRSRFREWLLGGTTREMLQSCKLPIMMTN